MLTAESQELKMAKISGVYLITNKINGKMYIGISVDIRRRWLSHKNHKKRGNCVIKDSIKKYGPDNFEFKVLVICDETDYNYMKFLENKLISSYNTLMPNGYNFKENAGGIDRTRKGRTNVG